MSFKSKRAFACGVAVLLLIVSGAVRAGEARAAGFRAAMTALENGHGGRIGVAALNSANGATLEFRADERFALCSTFKLLLAAAVLARVDAGVERLDRPIEYGPEDLQAYAPVAARHVADGSMTVSALAAAAMQYSDNTAANLLLARVGGPPGVTAYARSLGDEVTRLDRDEPSLNTNLPGDVRDTTTPGAMLDTVRKLLLGDALSSASRHLLLQWLIDNKTGDTKLRAGLDPSWQVGDKTGAGERGATNDIAIVWPPGRAPWLIAVYFSGSTEPGERRSAVIAEVGRIVGAVFGSRTDLDHR